MQVALVEGKLINITKHFKILFENPEDSWLSVTTYDECYNWICYDGTVFMDQPTYEVVRAEQNVIPND